MEAFAGNPEAFASADAEFHQRLANITHNPLLVFLLDTLRDLMVQVRSNVASLPNLAERVMPTHLEIVECVRRRDREGARAAMASPPRNLHRNSARVEAERPQEGSRGREPGCG